MRGQQRAQGDQDRAVEAEPGVRQGPRRPVAGEIHHHEQRDRAEDREHRRLGGTADGGTGRQSGDGDDRQHQTRAGGTAQGVVFGILVPQPVAQLLPAHRRRLSRHHARHGAQH
jgi:hypothetical protein